MDIPVQHLSVRIPWHDSAWNGRVCSHPRENGSCAFLPRISENKDPDFENEIAGQWIHELAYDKLPPCVAEKVHFMSAHPIERRVKHPYSYNPNNAAFYGHYKETSLRYPGYSFSVVPYSWMQKNREDNTSEKALEFGLPYHPEKEPQLNFENSWVQHIDNQKTLLDKFVSPIIPNESLVFIYAKNIPFVESTSRVLIGVGYVTEVGSLTEYEYDRLLPESFRSTLWERPVFHSIREGFANGFLLPYHDFFEAAAVNPEISVSEYIAFAPSFEEFSYGSEWVSNDSAIECLLLLAEKLKKMEPFLPGKDYRGQIEWIDKEISRLWKLRGPYPGLGKVLEGLKLQGGQSIAWEIDRLVRDSQMNVVENPWDYVRKLFDGDASFLSPGRRQAVSETIKATYKALSKEEKDFLEMLSRMNLSSGHVNSVIDTKEREQREYVKNPYLLYEKSRLDEMIFDISIIDKAVFTAEESGSLPIPEYFDISDPLDQRRIRAYGIKILEQACLEGHTLLADEQFVTRFDEQPVKPACNPSLRNLKAVEEFIGAEIQRFILDQESSSYYFKLARMAEIKQKISGFVSKRIRRDISPAIELDWEGIIDTAIQRPDAGLPKWYIEKDLKARGEKATALKVLSNSKVSVLIGPAGTGKTTLLKVLCDQPFISSGAVLKLAPTGKARVKMGKDAKTLAQFLIRADRYNPATGQYYLNPKAEQHHYETVIIDESSMLTEEQVAAVLDALTGVERLIFVGDYRQLPPIGAGRPFADIVEFLRSQGKGIAELDVLFRQSENGEIPHEEPDRLDIRLAKWFSDDEIKKKDNDIFKEIAQNSSGEWDNIRFVEWQSPQHLRDIIIEVTNSEIRNLLKIEGIETDNDRLNFDFSLGGTKPYENNDWIAFNIESAKKIENWQIISPLRTTGYGTKAVNQIIQDYFRDNTKQRAINPGGPRKMNRPVGDDTLVYGDKVINTRNIRLDKHWNKTFPENEEALKYIANGEIGIHVGKYGKWDYPYPRPLHIAFSSQPGYAYQFQESDFGEGKDLNLELAYTITVHKSQGSGFSTVLFILPNPCPILSRELFYTALTRQESRVVILHQGDFKDYRKYTTGEYSESGRRLTDLFEVPKLKEIKKKYYDSKYVQVSEKGEFMISKSEVIIADKLYHNNLQYAYEQPVTDDRGITIHPDFIVEDKESGIVYYWEHLGMLADDGYRSKWQRKKEWYERAGIVEYTADPQADIQLILTRDKPDGGIDSQEIKEIIDRLFK